MTRMNVGIIGLGLIGRKRAAAIRETRCGKLICGADTNPIATTSFAEAFQCKVVQDWRLIVTDSRIDAVVIAVPNMYLPAIALEAMKNKKHILCEKPFGTTCKEAVKMHHAAQSTGVVVKVGFNHRFHAALLKAHKIYQHGSIGELLVIRSRYGHGGRKHMEKEWRFDPKVSGGGELLDQGVHLLDLANWFAGPARSAYGIAQTKFWPSKVDDNAFGILRNKQVTFEFHVSTTNWKNIFSFEVFGTHGFLQIEGKGGSYGLEKLIFGRRRAEFGVPILQEFNFADGDMSWHREWINFVNAIKGKVELCGTTLDGVYANAAIDAIYRSSRTGREEPIRLAY